MKKAKLVVVVIVCAAFVLQGLTMVQAQQTPPITPSTSGVGVQLGNLTFQGIQSLLRNVLQQLENTGVTLAGEGNIVIGNASQELNNKIRDLERMVRENVSVPLASLGLDVQELSRQVKSSLDQLQFILSTQQACLLKNADLVLSSISNITNELKRPVPLDKTLPQVTHFQFDGSAPRAVPKEGGRLTVFGSGLWREENLPPIVKLQSADRQRTIQELTVQRAGAANSFSTTINGNSVVGNPGECLQLSVETRETTGILWWKKVVSTNLYLPMCISKAFTTEFVVNAEISYVTSTTVTEFLNEIEFRADNDSCESRKQVAGLQKHWEVPLGGHIVSFNHRTGPFNRHQSNVNFSINSSNTIVANGWLDKARCLCPPIGSCRLLSTTIHQSYIQARASFPRGSVAESTAKSPATAMTLPNTQIRVLIPKPEESQSTVFSFSVQKYVNGKPVGPVFNSPRTTVNTSGGTSPVGNMEGLQVSGNFNPRPVNGKAELVVTIQGPNCGN
jgi:hypothetical protein